MELNTGKELQNGKYRILGILGQGGFGITYLAEQTSLGRKVAIKEFFMKDLCNRDDDGSHVSVPSVGSKELVERFRQKFLKEARSIASLEHKHIVPIIDVFEENGTAYYVMKYFGGGSLSACTALSEEKALRYTRQIASAIGFIHSRHMMHLDIKPGNILLDSEDNAIVIDFGLAKQYDEAGHQTSTTPVGISHGYAPLEQYKAGGVSSFSPATDIYSLGATLYRLLTDNRPADAMDLVSSPFPACPANVSASTWNAVKSAMQPAISSRPQSVEEFLRLVESGEMKDESGEMKDATSIFGNASSDGSSAASQNVMPLGSQKASVAKDERAKSKDATCLSMGTGQNTANGNAAVEENEIAVEVVEVPSAAQKPASEPKQPKEKKSGKGLWIVILLLLIICGTVGGFMLFGSSSDVKKDSAKDTVKQIAQKADTPNQESPLAKETKDTPTIQTDKKDTITPLQQTVSEEPAAEQTTQLKINGAPNGAYVYVDGNYFDETPLKDATISIGRHTIKVVKEGYETYEKKHTFNSHAAAITVNLVAKAKPQLQPQPQPQETISSKSALNGHEYVDLGLSVKWATYNVGASKPEGYGNHYAWGETFFKVDYDNDNYTILTYGEKMGDIGGNPKYDVARKHWGGSWRLPTKAEFDELRNNCEWQWTKQNGVNGYKVTSKKNGNSIFLPAAGWRHGTSLYDQGTYGYYWSSTPRESDSRYAYYLSFYSGVHNVGWYSRSYGQSVRPVTK